MAKIKKGWDKNHWEYHCAPGCKLHNSFWKVVVTSPQWEAWEKEQARRFSKWDKTAPVEGVFDVDESRECNWISANHFQAFLSFVVGK